MADETPTQREIRLGKEHARGGRGEPIDLQLQGLRNRGWTHEFVKGEEGVDDQHVWRFVKSPTHHVLIFSQSPRLFYRVASVLMIDGLPSTALHPQTPLDCTHCTSLYDAEAFALRCDWRRIHESNLETLHRILAC